MKRIIRKLMKIYYLKIKKVNPMEYEIQRMRKTGLTIGKDCRIFTFIRCNEATLVTIGDRVTISGGVEFCTHDNAIIKAIPGKTDVVGRITIGDDCFIGMRAILLYGVTLGDHCIVGAGSVVTRSFPPHTVIAGNPARAICTTEEYAEKYRDLAIDLKKIPKIERAAYFDAHPEIMAVR